MNSIYVIMRYIFFAVLFILTLSVMAVHFSKDMSKTEIQERQTIYKFVVKDLQGKDFDFSLLKGKKIMVVNTASKCGLTPQYKGLQKLYDAYKDKDFVVVGFPSNDFLWQEPGSPDEIAAFCKLNYGVTFPILEKIKVKGKNKHPIYGFLTEKQKNGLQDSKVKWNFQKYLIDREGYLVKVISPKTKPHDPEVISWIEE